MLERIVATEMVIDTYITHGFDPWGRQKLQNATCYNPYILLPLIHM